MYKMGDMFQNGSGRLALITHLDRDFYYARFCYHPINDVKWVLHWNIPPHFSLYTDIFRELHK